MRDMIIPIIDATANLGASTNLLVKNLFFTVITSSILILAILLIRQLVKGRLHPLLQYSLWLLVVCKLLIPVPLWSSHVSILNLFADREVWEDMQNVMAPFSQNETGIQNMQGQLPIAADGYSGGNIAAALSFGGMPDIWAALSFDNMPDTETGVLFDGVGMSDAVADIKAGLSLKTALCFIWIAGILLTGGYMVFYQIKWQRYLHANRKTLNISDRDYKEPANAFRIPLSVYIVNGLPSPCLSGQNIYLTEEMAEDKKQLEHILAHEYCHYRQFDSLWVIVRCMLTAIYWFNPFVWIAAYVSKRDSEYACDAAVIRMLGEDERVAYGKTLINLIAGVPLGRGRIGIASMMGGGEKGVRERILKIARKPKYIAVTAGVVILIAAGLTAATFSGAWKEDVSVADAENTESAKDVENIEDIENTGTTETTDTVSVTLSTSGTTVEVLQPDMNVAHETAIERAEAEKKEEAERLETEKKEELERLEAELKAEMARLEASEADIAKEVEGMQAEAIKTEAVLSKPFHMEDDGPLPWQSVMQMDYINPCPSYTRISDTFGARVNPVTQEEITHDGVDFAAKQGSDIVAAAEGTVYKTGYDSTYGNYVALYHGLDAFTYYACCAEILVAEGDSVEEGQKIATVGSTGRSTGPHLHFMVSSEGEYVEPVFAPDIE